MSKGMIRGLFAAAGLSGAALWFVGQDIDPMERTERYDMAGDVARVSVVDERGHPILTDDVPVIEDIMAKTFLGFSQPDNEYLHKLQDDFGGIKARLVDGVMAQDSVTLHISPESGLHFSFPKEAGIKDNGQQGAVILDEVFDRDQSGQTIYGSYSVDEDGVLYQPPNNTEFRAPKPPGA